MWVDPRQQVQQSRGLQRQKPCNHAHNAICHLSLLPFTPWIFCMEIWIWLYPALNNFQLVFRGGGGNLVRTYPG